MAEVAKPPVVPAPGASAESVDEGTNIVAVLCNDHDRIKHLYHSYKDPVLSLQQRVVLVQDLVHELTRYTWAEQEVLHPALADALGGNLARHMTNEHASLKLIMCDLTALDPEKERDAWCGKVEQLMEVLLELYHEEEHGALAELRMLLSREQMAELGMAYLAARERAPKRPEELRCSGEESSREPSSAALDRMPGGGPGLAAEDGGDEEGLPEAAEPRSA